MKIIGYREADNLQGLANRGMKPRAYAKRAKELYAKAARLQKNDLRTPSIHGR
jgi:hypothetical protein